VQAPLDLLENLLTPPARIADHPARRIAELLPCNWQPRCRLKPARSPGAYDANAGLAFASSWPKQ
jgi:hypothetical protein